MVPGYLGGGFGSKTYAKIEPLTACLAWKAGRTVRLTLSREECFLLSVKHPSMIKIKTGVTKEGRFKARKTEIYLDTGAYADIGPRIAKNCGYVSCGPFKMPNAWVDSHCVYTHKAISGPFRGFGVAQVSWAFGQQNDIIAHELGMDPVEFLNQNLLEEGDEFVTTSIMREINFKENLRLAAEAIGWSAPKKPAAEPHVKVGRGVAVAVKSTVTPSTSSAFVKVNNDGSVALLCATVDMGQGSDAVMAQIAAETLGVTYDMVKLAHPDTDVSPYDQMTASSRSTFHVGAAVSLAADDAKRQILELASDLLEVGPEDMDIREGRVFPKTDPSRQITVQEVIQNYFGMDGGNILGRGVLKTKGGKLDRETGLALEKDTTVYWFPAGGAVEVEVDTETGVVRLRKLVNVVDVGKALNPQSCKQQVAGSAMMALGQTFYESLNFDNGRPLNPHFMDYILPSFGEIPDEMEDILIETQVREGPYGARGTGETSITPPSPAVANAIFDAVGVRIYDLPITPEKVLRALRDKEAHSSPE
jgi:CO/xanthine dehydrogenase Mo-binding subunit